jgi:deltex
MSAVLILSVLDRYIFMLPNCILVTGLDNNIVWNGAHHKTSPCGGTSQYGWPDNTYFFRVKEELKSKGIKNGPK